MWFVSIQHIEYSEASTLLRDIVEIKKKAGR